MCLGTQRLILSTGHCTVYSICELFCVLGTRVEPTLSGDSMTHPPRAVTPMNTGTTFRSAHCKQYINFSIQYALLEMFGRMNVHVQYIILVIFYYFMGKKYSLKILVFHTNSEKLFRKIFLLLSFFHGSAAKIHTVITIRKISLKT